MSVSGLSPSSQLLGRWTRHLLRIPRAHSVYYNRYLRGRTHTDALCAWPETPAPQLTQAALEQLHRQLDAAGAACADSLCCWYRAPAAVPYRNRGDQQLQDCSSENPNAPPFYRPPTVPEADMGVSSESATFGIFRRQTTDKLS